MSIATLEPKTVAAPAPAAVRTKSPASQFERYDTIHTPKIVVVGFISAILTFCVVLSAQAVFFAADNVEAGRKAAAGVATPLTEGLTQQETQLAGYGWVDPAKGVVNIPVDNAMNLIVQEQQKAQKTEAGK